MINYSYYPGCSLHSSGIEYDISLKAISQILGIELREIPGWICCGASSAHQTSHLLSISLPAKNLSEVEKAGFDSVVVPCAACYQRLKTAKYELENSDELSKEINGIINYQFKNKVKVLHTLEIFKNGVQEKIKNSVKRNLSKIKIVCYYGCLLTRPPKVMQFAKRSEVPTDVGDDCEYPVSMDDILRDVGVNVLDWGYKTDCCGASLSLTKSEIVLRLINNIFEDAEEVGADAISVACPLCHANLDTRQEEVNRTYNKNYNLPVFYFTQLLGLAFGIEPKKLGLNKHFVSLLKLLEKVG